MSTIARWELEGCANWASETVYLNGFQVPTVEPFHLCSEHDRQLKTKVEYWLRLGEIADTIIV